jgi:hypothetical protein
MSRRSVLPQLLQECDQRIAQLQRRTAHAVMVEQSQPAAAQQSWHRSQHAMPALPPAPVVTGALDQRIEDLEHIRDLVRTTPELVAVIDAVIGNELRAVERRERAFGLLQATVSLVAGWLLSMIGEPALTHLFQR